MQKPSPGNVQKKASSEILFAEYGKNRLDGEDPTPENKRVIDLYEPVDAMSLNREKDRVVVSGIRGVLQIIKIQKHGTGENEAPSIVKDLDMRVYRKGKVNILYSAQNVKWNQLYDQYIATTSSNGSIVCWNVSRKNKSVFKAHERSATCLDWHATAPYILVSGSRDCTVRSYDMRVKDHHQLTFSDRTCESIRDIAMCKAPGFDDYFFTGDDGGVLRLWDLRQTKRWVLQKVAHRSFVSTMSMNPHNRRLIATGGGRDKMVKIWEWTGPELNRVSVVETTAPLGRLAWRPDKPYHLATCASVNEASVHVWDVRRPYLPYVTYDEHRDAVTDACWPCNDFDVFMTCGKDGLVVLHNIDSGHAPVSYACDVAFDITPDGTLGLAVNSEIHAKNDAEHEAQNATVNGKKVIRQIPYESFRKPIKSLIGFGIPEALTHSLPPTTFHNIAQKYLIGGVEIVQLCETNSKIARKNGLEHVAQTWRLVEALCEQAKIQDEYNKQTAEEKARIVRAWAVRKKELAEEGRRWLANLNDHYRDDIKKQVSQRLENTQHVTAFLKFSSSSESDEASDEEEEENNKEAIDRIAPNFDILNRKKRRKKKNGAPTDFYFGAGEVNFKLGNREKIHANEFMGLGPEAYELRDEEKERRFFCKAAKQPSNAEEYEELQKEMEDHEADFQKWSPMLEIYRLLLYHAEQGDMQTCATISMVCGKRLLDAVDHYTINGWIKCYMEMLYSLELFLVMAKIRKYCTLDSISAVSRENTTIQLAHADCDALIVNGRCTKCEALAQADCTLCRFPIVGLTFQCHVCGHCMHADHAYEWFKKTNTCGFTGCPCTCGKNTWPDMDRSFIGNDEVMRDHRKFKPDPADYLDEDDLEPGQKLPPVDNRVDASRLDTDSDPSGDDLEWSPRNSKIKTKYNKTPHNSRHVNLLVKMYSLRKKESEALTPLDKMDRPPQAKLIEDEEDLSKFLVQDNRKEEEELLLREEWKTEFEKLVQERDQILEYESNPEDGLDIDRTELTREYCKLPEEYRGKRKRPRSPTMDVPNEEDEDLSASDDSEGELARKRERREIVEETRYVRQYIGWLKVRGLYFKEEDLEAKGFYAHDRWTDLNDKDYIKSIGPIGLQSYQLQFNDEMSSSDEENERVTSPTLTVATRNHLKSLMESSGYYDSSDNDELETEEKEEASEEGGKEQTSILTPGERALQILNMTKDDLKKKKAKKRRKKVNTIYENMFSASKASLNSPSSSDDFLVSTSDSDDKSSSQSIRIDYNADSEESESTCQEELSSDVPSTEEEKEDSEVEVLKEKNYGKECKDIKFTSPGVGPNRKAKSIIFIEGVNPSPTSSEISSSPVSTIDSCPSSHSPSSSPSYHSDSDSDSDYDGPVGIPRPPTPPRKKRVPPSYWFRLSSKEDLIEEVDEVEEAEEYEEHYYEDEEEEEEERFSPPPSRKTSLTVPMEPPAITSCANPIFSRITGRPPPSKPVSINGSLTSLTNGEGMHSAPGTNAVANPLFETRSSLPTHHLTVNGFNHRGPESGANSRKSSTSSLYYTPENKLSNGAHSDHLLMIAPSPLTSRNNSHISLANENGVFGSHHSQVNGTENGAFKKPLPPTNPRENGDTSDSNLFSTDEEDLVKTDPEETEQPDEPFFPQTEDLEDLKLHSTKHPWETEEQYENRLRSEWAEEAVERKENNEKTEDLQTRLGKNTPMMKELARRQRRREVRKSLKSKEGTLQERVDASLKRAKFTYEDCDAAVKKAVENLKQELPDYESVESSDGDYKEFKKDKEHCVSCRKSFDQETEERHYVNWIKETTEENQMFYGKSLDDECSIYQLRHMDTHVPDVTQAQRTAGYLIQFIKIFYFIEWDELLKPDCELLLKEVYEMWNDFRIKRKRVCREHFRDYKFRFFASSIATKMKQHLLMGEDPRTKQSLICYDWAHLTSCTNTMNDAAELVDETMDVPLLSNPQWTLEEGKIANRYWDLFGEIPIHIVTSGSTSVRPASIDCLEMIDDSNYFTKKMIRNAMRNSRNYDIRLAYSRKKKKSHMLQVQDRSREALNKEWQMRLEKMINDVQHVDFSESTFKIDPDDKMIYTTDSKHPYPIVQFDSGDHYVTVQPMISKRYIDFKSHLRNKFAFRRSQRLDKDSGIAITTEKLRKLPSFKKFEPKLQKAKEYKEMMSTHFKVMDRTIVDNRHNLNTIIEEGSEVELIVEMLGNRPIRPGRKQTQPEDVFGERKDIWERRDEIKLARMTGEKYRSEVEDYERHEKEKMNIMRRHWVPDARKKIFMARKALEIGRVMLEQDVRKWMEYQYDLCFARKTLRRKSYLSKQQLMKNLPTHYFDSLYKIDFNVPKPPPPYSKSLPPVPIFQPEPGPPAFNSSSDEEDYDVGDVVPEDKSFVTFEKQPDLLGVAGRIQFLIKEKVDEADSMADDEWEYSDDSSISDWFENDTDDMLNRLANVDYVDEHLALKERMKGALGRKLYEIKMEREDSGPSSDEEMYEKFEKKRNAKLREYEEADEKWLKENPDPKDIGTSDGKRVKALMKMESDRDEKLMMRREERKNEMEQLRWFLNQYKLDHSYTTEPYVWNKELLGAISCLHQKELRRVNNRFHKIMREEYENAAEKEEMIVNTIPIDETSLEFKLINFLLFRRDGESLEKSKDRAKSAEKLLKPMQKYEMFFGKEVFYKVAALSRKALTDHHIRESFAQLIRRWGNNLTINSECLSRFYKVWWMNSSQTLQQFISSYDTLEYNEKIICEGAELCQLQTENLEIARETYDNLELAFILNDMIFVVEQYVEETQNLFERATLLEEKAFYSMMEFDTWYDWKHRDCSEDEFIEPDDEEDTLSLRSLFHSSTSEEEQPKENGISVSSDSGASIKSYQAGEPNKLKPYSVVSRQLKDFEEEKHQRKAEEESGNLLLNWAKKEMMLQWEFHDVEKKLHDYLMMDLAVNGEWVPPAKSINQILEDKEIFRDEPNTCGIYDIPGLSRENVLEMCGLPIGLDNQMFTVEKIDYQIKEESISDASDIADEIERGFEDEEEFELRNAYIDDDAQSYSSIRHISKHELHFQRELESRSLPSCVVIFTPEMFFEDSIDTRLEFNKWKKIIEVSECPFSFNKLVMRERLLRRCRDHCQQGLLDKYFQPTEQNRTTILEVLEGCLILVVISSELKPMGCRVISYEDISAPAHNRVSYLKKRMVEESQTRLPEWLELHKIDMEVYSRCPVIPVFDDVLNFSHTEQLSDIFIDDHIREEWLVITREEGVRALDTIIRLPPPPDNKLAAYKIIFKPIYDTWYHIWKFENAQANATTPIIRKFDPVKEYLHKARMIVNYAHQHYRMKRFDSLMSKDPTEFQLVDRSDVPSASLFDSLDAAVSKFCYEDSPHLDEKSRQVVKDSLIQLATGKIPYFTANYSGGYDYTQNFEATPHAEENHEEKQPIARNTEYAAPELPSSHNLELEDCQDEMDWLRSLYEESDFQKRRFMAGLMFQIAQKALFKFAPGIADFERAKNRFEHLLTLHGKQRPLLDMMLTKVRGTYFMPLETNMFLYHAKLITFGELVDSEIHPKIWKNRRVTFEDYRRQGPISPYAMADFMEMNHWDELSDDGSDLRSDTSSSLGGSRESLSSSRRASKRARQARRAYTSRARMDMEHIRLQAKPQNPDEAFYMEKRALGHKQYRLRRRLSEYLEPISDLDRNRLRAKLPSKRHDLLNFIGDLIVDNSETAHWSWGPLRMRTKIGRIPPVNRMKPKHFNRIDKGKKMYKPPKPYDAEDLLTSGRKWF